MLFRSIRTLPSDAANVPIVAMTANAFEEDKQKVIRAGMNARIAKPIEAGRLMETLSHILTKRIPKVQLSGSFLSAAEFADFILNEPTRRGGELVDAANARKVAAIDGVRGGNARVFTHEDGGDADALRAQGAHLLRCVVDADLPVVVAAERDFAARQYFVAVVG